MFQRRHAVTERPRRGIAARVAAALSLTAVMVLAGVTPASAADVRGYQYWIDKGYGIQDAWKTTKGKGARIAVMDSGVGKGSDAFKGVVGGKDMSGIGGKNGRKPVGPKDEKNHGSWVASIAAGRSTGSGSMIGVAPEADLLAISIGFGASGSTVPFEEQVAKGIHWAVDHDADVINMSFSTNTKEWDPSWDEAFKYAFDHDVIVVAAAGNRGSGTTMVGAPATMPGVLTVAGVDKKGKVSEEASTEGITIGVSAPSEDLTGISADGTPVLWAGTSGASPIVAGMVALVRSAYPDMSADDVINRVVKTAHPSKYQKDDVPSADYGYGLADVGKAIDKDIDSVDSNPMGSLDEWIKVNRRAEADSVKPPKDTTKVKALPPVSQEPTKTVPFWPTPWTLKYISIPAALVLGAGTLVTLGAIGATRHAKRVARKK